MVAATIRGLKEELRCLVRLQKQYTMAKVMALAAEQEQLHMNQLRAIERQYDGLGLVLKNHNSKNNGLDKKLQSLLLERLTKKQKIVILNVERNILKVTNASKYLKAITANLEEKSNSKSKQDEPKEDASKTELAE